MNRPPHFRPLALVAMLAAATPAAAGTFSWFDPPAATREASVWSPRYAAFAVDLYRTPDPEHADENTLRVTGGLERDVLAPPAARPFDIGTEDTAPRLRTFGVAWQHRLDTASHVTFSADYNRDAPRFLAPPELADTRASLSLTNRWAGDYRPSLTGSMFVGGERGTTEAYRQLGRRYYGLSLGGELALSSAHRPYLSLQMQRGVTDGDEALPTGLYDDRSQIAAGWKWQAQRHLSLQAEASYGNSSDRFRLQNPEHTRLFFGTRFDFK